MPRNAMNSKDGIWAILNQYESSIGFCKQAERVMDALMITDGLWEELSYSYKAAEIATHIISMCNRFDRGCTHHMTCERLFKIKTKAYEVQRHFNSMQNDRMYSETSEYSQQAAAATIDESA